MLLSDIDLDELKAQTETLGLVLSLKPKGSRVREHLEGIWNLCHTLMDAIEDVRDLVRHNADDPLDWNPPPRKEE